jgi:hypothetical protein
MQLICPNCRREIPTEDVNVAKDIALCRSCNQTFSFAELVQEGSAPAVDLMRPPRGVWFRQDMRGFELGASMRSPAAFFLVPFMALWSGGSLGGIYGSQIHSGKFNLTTSLFGIPFLIGTILLGAFPLMMICGRISIAVQGDQGRIFTGVGPIGWTRRFKWSAVTTVSQEPVGYSKNGQPQVAIVLQGDNNLRLKFASGIKEERRYFMLNALRSLLRKREGGVYSA